MTAPFLLSRILLQFNSDESDLLRDISTAAFTPDGSLWLGSDELQTLERLSPIEPNLYGDHQQYEIKEFIDLFSEKGEVDIEGMDHSEPYLWVVGSHSPKRNKPKGKNSQQDIERLAEIEIEQNRYLLARIPVLGGEPFKACTHPDYPDRQFTAAQLKQTEQSNVLIEALCQDIHLGPFVEHQLPSKENGFDIEGLAIKGDRVFLGLRGPVLRGWAMILELEVEEESPGVLTLKAIGKKDALYRKHFFNLNGFGIREICFHGQDLLILAGPTMHLETAMQVFRWKNALGVSEETVNDQDEDGNLAVEFTLDFTLGHDHAEGLALRRCLGNDGLLVVYDAPNPKRLLQANELLVDVFKIGP